MEQQLTPHEALRLCLRKAGSQEKLGHELGCSQTAVWKMLHSSRRMSHQFVLIAERAFDVPRYVLRPDIYPHPLLQVEAFDDVIEDTLANPLNDRFCAIDLGTPQRMAAGARR